MILSQQVVEHGLDADGLAFGILELCATVGAAFGQKRAHGAVYAHHTRTSPQSVKGRDVAEAHNPLPGCPYFVERQLVDEMVFTNQVEARYSPRREPFRTAERFHHP